MLIKTFRAKSIQEALQLVRDKLGPDACVLNTREVRSVIGRRMVEVEAGQAYQATINPSAQDQYFNHHESTVVGSATLANIAEPDDEPSIASQLLQAELQSDESQSIATDKVEPSTEQLNSTAARMSTIDAAMSNGSSVNDKPSELENRITDLPDARSDEPVVVDSVIAKGILQELVHAGIEPGFAKQLIQTATKRCAPEYRHDSWLIRGQLTEMVAEKIKAAAITPYSPDEQRIIAAVGPNGVGKTTLLGKIATRAFRDFELQIGFITLDTWRSGAVEKLLELAELVSAEVEVIGSLDQFIPALQRLREFDLVMIDTAGRSPQDSAGLQSLQEFLQVAQPDETHLVMPASASTSYIKQALEKFKSIKPTHLSISKLDECSEVGQWLVPLCLGNLPVQYLSSGNQMETDLYVPNARRLAGLILGQSAQTSTQA